MRVLFLPKTSNPYQELLRSELEKRGIKIRYNATFPSVRWLTQHRHELWILHLHWPGNLYALGRRYFIQFMIRLIFARLLGYKIVWTVHNLLPHESNFPRVDLLGRFVIVLFSRAIIVHCEYAKTELARRFFRKRGVFVIPHGHYADHYPHGMSKHDARQKLGLRPSGFIYLFLGNIRPYKGLEQLIQTFLQLDDQGTELVIAGLCIDDELKDTLMKLTKNHDRIRVFLKFIPDETVQCFLAAADVFIVPFSNILTSGSVILGLSFGLPVITPALGCLPELITPQTGMLYDPHDENGLFHALQTIRHKDVGTMGQNAHQTMRSSDFSWGTVADKTLQVYRSCCSKGIVNL